MTHRGEAFSAALLTWFDVHGRHHLPWQREPSPYRVWVSEVMLQQTQVATVIPFYERFMARFPTVQSLAAAGEDEVLHLWTGLGYYARARNLRRCAQVLVAAHGGEFPADLAAVTALPGIGRSTAGAILALSRNERHPILDGNVKRVLARVFGIGGDPSSAAVLAALWALAEECTPNVRVADYTQAIMDLGATVCSRSRAACTVCPMNGLCIAAREGRQAELPGAKPRRVRPVREATLLIAERAWQPADGHAKAAGGLREGERVRVREVGDTGVRAGGRAILLKRRPSPGIWGGLWSPPQFEGEAAAMAWVAAEFGAALDGVQRLDPIRHAFTHFELTLHPVRVRLSLEGRGHAAGVASAASAPSAAGVREGAGDRLWYALDDPPRVGLPQPIRDLIGRLERRGVGDAEAAVAPFLGEQARLKG